ncbi:Type II secretory pathway component PulF [Gaiella occulta]|uniref:Type II secretory pathway component PulF n=1 Tax=Gaiella occulta TaxID=1002870 RepID=A0A7M2YVW0_9ACTN|nr:type II secretion system F family protein [Gaiella occulta]RDI73558.1 Type II secretory pathway component PulF [Gaiella occulta]
MPSFAYSAINAQGAELTGEIQAADLSAARDALRGNGLLAQRVEELRSPAPSSRKSLFETRKVKPKSLQVFSRQFATMIEAGLSVVTALVILEQQTDDKALAAVIADIREQVETGALLSEAMARHTTVFSRLYIAMVEAGEAAGVLDTVLDRVAIQIEKEERIKRRVKGAMIYPSVVLTFATLVMTGMLMFLVPIFVKIFDQLGGELPTLTQYVLYASNALRGYWFVIFPVVGLSLWSFFRWKRTEPGRQAWDRFKLRLPAQIGSVVRKIAMARWSRTLSTLIASGVDIMRALEITAQTSGNWVVEEETGHLRARVQEGASIAQPLIDSEVFPPMVAQMVKIGEETGELEKMLSKVADFYEDEVDASIAALTSIIEPLMMVGVGVMVGIIIISMYLPMFKMLSLVK